MPKMFRCKRIEPSATKGGLKPLRSTVDLAVTPEQLFEVLADSEAWPRWTIVITDVTWTSPAPRGVGATRTVCARGGLTVDEKFIAWEPPSRMAFWVTQCTTRALAGMTEDYFIEVVPVGCRLTWTAAPKLAGAEWVTMVVGRPLLQLTMRRALANLRTYTDARFTGPQDSHYP